MRNEDPVLSNYDGADYAGQEHKTWDNYRSLGKGPAYLKVGAKVFYRKSAIDRWLKEREVHPGPEAA